MRLETAVKGYGEVFAPALSRSWFHRSPQHTQDSVEALIRTGSPAHDGIQQVIVRKSEQLLESLELFVVEACQMAALKLFQNQIKFEQTAAAMPTDSAQFCSGHALIRCA